MAVLLTLPALDIFVYFVSAHALNEERRGVLSKLHTGGLVMFVLVPGLVGGLETFLDFGVKSQQ